MTEENIKQNGFSWDKVMANDYEFANIPKDRETGEGKITLKFLDNEPCKVTFSQKYKNDVFMFRVEVPKDVLYRNKENMTVKSKGEEKVFSISSMRMMEQLKELLPIQDKTFNIKCDGVGFDTTYVIEEI